MTRETYWQHRVLQAEREAGVYDEDEHEDGERPYVFEPDTVDWWER